MEFTRRLVSTLDDLDELRAWLARSRPVLAVDTETTGTDWSRDEIRLLQLGDSAGAWALPMPAWAGPAADMLSSYGRPVAAHNHKFDSHFLRQCGVRLPPERHDTMTMVRLAEPDMRVGLKSVAQRLGHPLAGAGSDLSRYMKANKLTWADMDPTDPRLWEYGAADVIMTAAVWEAYSGVCSTGLYQLEMSVQAELEQMESTGMAVDTGYLERLRGELAQEERECLDEASRAGADLASRKSVLKALAAAGWEPPVYTLAGAPSLAADALKGCEIPLAKLYTRYKAAQKVRTTWVDDLLARERGGTVHASMNSTGTVTGRMAVTAPALQTLPRGSRVRRAFIAREGCKLVACDYAQQELRIIAVLSRDPALKAAFDTGDVHTATAQRVFGTSEPTPEQRQTAKSTVFAICYGAGADRLSASFGYTESEAASIRAAFTAAFPAATALVSSVSAAAASEPRGRISCKTPFGRKQVVEADKAYMLANHTVQGTGADVLKSAIVRVGMSDNGGSMRLAVHDELICEVQEHGAARRAAEIASTMTDTRFDPVLQAEAVVMSDWGEKYA